MMRATIIWLAIASLCASAYSFNYMEEVQWRTDDYRPFDSNELERATAGCDLVADAVDTPDRFDNILWGYEYRIAFTKCMRSKG